ncbi:metal dependent phosphohydrolase [Pyrobaculum islandicum DSM 4184]|uniref:Metal dependent phosphohydrolase n=1 Tax=Pyrobaculum islandicum (strain DSM 4184 / JCM 9189 / GEO3) TaxID=384616 RepID=A1RSH7_PYRIL|nr:HD domain-containing protein [Pyrobaculum islandicum]ABL87909.1 metal dependent phosphohydrolase [Pyrobaculum islandicum DSM 4184]
MQYKKAIRDPIHGFIKLTEEEVKLIDGEPFIQRLRYVKQLGFVYLVYPTATHTRFDHSLGVMHIATLIGERVLNITGDFDEDALRHLRVAALLHDIGHLPFSHSFEVLTRELLHMASKRGCIDIDIAQFDVSKPHEVTTKLLIEKIAPKLSELGYDPKLIESLLFKEDRRYSLLSYILSGVLDADRLDYIMRDMYFTGAAVGTSFTHIDLERIIENLEVVDGRFQFNEKARVNLEGYLITRYNLYRHVYLHHKTVLFTEVARNIVADNIARCTEGIGDEIICQYLCDLARFIAGQLNEEELWKATDDYFISVFTRDTRFRDLLSRKPLQYIPLWKREKDFIEIFKDPGRLNETIDKLGPLHWALVDRLKKKLVERLNVELGEFEKCRLSYDDVLISYVSFDPYAEDLYITTAMGPIAISKISPLVEAINEAWKRAPHIFLYVKKDVFKKCGNYAVESLKSVLEPLMDLTVRRILA